MTNADLHIQLKLLAQDPGSEAKRKNEMKSFPEFLNLIPLCDVRVPWMCVCVWCVLCGVWCVLCVVWCPCVCLRVLVRQGDVDRWL